MRYDRARGLPCATLLFLGASASTGCAGPDASEPDEPALAQQASGAHAGAWVARRRVLADDPSYHKLIAPEVILAPGKRYIGSIWARGNGRIRLDVINFAWTTTFSSTVIDATPTWQRFAVPEFSVSRETTVRLYLYDTVGEKTGDLFFDDAFVGQAGGANLLTNAGFEQGSAHWELQSGWSVEEAGASTGPIPSPGGKPDAGPGAKPTDADPIQPDPDGTYFSEVTANGTGCPRDTWNTRISRDGLVFTTTFSAYEARLDPASTLAVKDCQLAIKIHTPAGTSFSVQTFSYGGFAFLQPGVTGRQLATYSFQGQALQANAARTDLKGPYDDDFVFKDDVDVRDAVWSPCGVERDLNVTTRILLQSSAPGASGYMNLTAADGSARLILKLRARGCNEFGTLR